MTYDMSPDTLPDINLLWTVSDASNDNCVWVVELPNEILGLKFDTIISDKGRMSLSAPDGVEYPIVDRTDAVDPAVFACGTHRLMHVDRAGEPGTEYDISAPIFVPASAEHPSFGV